MKPATQSADLRSWPAAIWPLVLAAAILYASATPATRLPGGLFPGSDKLIHFLLYGLLASLVARVPAVRRWPLAGIGWAIVLASAFGIGDECWQSLTPGRSVEFADWCADTLGGVVAVAVYEHWSAYRRLLERPLARRKPRIEIPANSPPNPEP
jgi:VanZ family protein